MVDTVLFHVNALTGEDATGKSPGNDVLQGEDIVSGPLVEAFLLRTDSGRAVVCLDEFLQVHLYPNSDEAVQAFEKAIPLLRIPLKSGPPGQRRLSGHQIPSQIEFTGKHIPYQTWSLPFPQNEDIPAVFARPTGHGSRRIPWKGARQPHDALQTPQPEPSRGRHWPPVDGAAVRLGPVCRVPYTWGEGDHRLPCSASVGPGRV